MSGTSKDHKKADDVVKGPDVRPICAAMVGPNHGITTLASRIVRAVEDEADVGFVSKSTEETIHKIENYNKTRNVVLKEGDKIIVGSMDLVKWYPTMVPESNAKTVRKMVEESEIEFKGIDYDDVAKFLGETLTKEKIIEEGLEELVYIKKKKQTIKKLKKKVKKITRR